MVSPTQRTLALLRKRGYRAAVVERWNAHSRTRHDLFGIVDVVGIREGETVGVQATSRSNVSSRIQKIAESDAIADVRAAGWRVLVHGWGKMANGRWECREVDVS